MRGLSYTAVKTQVTNGKLLGSVKHAAGYSPMPQGGNKLSDCQITQITNWINAAAPNN
jgi:mono/diheme cytochrome c family protein